jgi:hypothetical protein
MLNNDNEIRKRRSEQRTVEEGEEGEGESERERKKVYLNIRLVGAAGQAM